MFDESLITSDVCISCGACCSVYVRKGTTELVMLDEVASDEEVEVIACPHLRTENNQYVCGNYENRPAVCRAYNCLTRANRDGLDMSEDKALPNRVRSAVRRVFNREIESLSIVLVD